jgi:hypothetical protein
VDDYLAPLPGLAAPGATVFVLAVALAGLPAPRGPVPGRHPGLNPDSADVRALSAT